MVVASNDLVMFIESINIHWSISILLCSVLCSALPGNLLLLTSDSRLSYHVYDGVVLLTITSGVKLSWIFPSLMNCHISS